MPFYVPGQRGPTPEQARARIREIDAGDPERFEGEREVIEVIARGGVWAPAVMTITPGGGKPRLMGYCVVEIPGRPVPKE
jgi:hypothetical protein